MHGDLLRQGGWPTSRQYHTAPRRAASMADSNEAEIGLQGYSMRESAHWADSAIGASELAESRRSSVHALSCSRDRKSTRLNSSHPSISYAVFCLKKKKSRWHECTLT